MILWSFDMKSLTAYLGSGQANTPLESFAQSCHLEPLAGMLTAKMAFISCWISILLISGVRSSLSCPTAVLRRPEEV